MLLLHTTFPLCCPPHPTHPTAVIPPGGPTKPRGGGEALPPVALLSSTGAEVFVALQQANKGFLLVYDLASKQLLDVYKVCGVQGAKRELCRDQRKLGPCLHTHLIHHQPPLTLPRLIQLAAASSHFISRPPAVCILMHHVLSLYCPSTAAPEPVLCVLCACCVSCAPSCLLQFCP